MEPAPLPAPIRRLIVRPNAPAPDEVLLSAVMQEAEGKQYKLRGRARLETREVLIEADELDYNEDTGYAEARGNVFFRHFQSHEELRAARVEYNVADETGRFYEIRGSSPAKMDVKPGLLVTPNPFSFEGEWAERLKDRYILHNGFVTNCKVRKPIWTLSAPKFDIIPGERAIAERAIFRVGKIPLFYTPYFFKSLERRPRKSGFLTPSFGNSSRRGKMLGGGYYWAINRSYDLTYRGQLFTQRGLAHTVDFRGRPSESSEINAFVYGVNDRGYLPPGGGERIKQGGYLITVDGRADLGHGFRARGTANYLSSFVFRQAFTETFNEAVFSEVQSVGFVTRNWSTYGLNLVFSRKENFQTAAEGDKISIRRLPELEFSSRDRQLSGKILPVWVSFDASAGLLRRNQPLFQTRSYVDRLDVEPRITTRLRWKDFTILPAFSVRETRYGSTFDRQQISVSGGNVLRSSREFTLDLAPPSLARVFPAPKWMGDRVKHVIEPRAFFRYVGGVDDFRSLLRFDETELLSNTREAGVSVTNRLFVKKGSGQAVEALTWTLAHARYFDPDFGGALIEEQRNVLISSTQLSGYTFLTGPRNYSPFISSLRMSPMPAIGIEWRADYDPLLHRLTNSSVTADARVSKYFVSLGHASVRNAEYLSPPYNQFRGLFGIGNENKRGWNAAFSAFYDFRAGAMQFATAQLTYNLDCCGVSFQYRRFGIAARNENQFRVAFVIANIGSFGTLKPQERIF